MATTASCRLIVLCSAFICISLLLASPVTAQTLFTDVTEQVGLDAFPGRSARNVVFVDYDNDGFQDVFFTENRSSARRIGLFHNNGDGRLVDQTFRVPADLHVREGEGGGIFGDYDNDGDEDLFLPVWPHNVLLRNDRGLFTQVDAGSDLTDSLWTDNAVWLDYDRDGYLDLYVAAFYVARYFVGEDDAPHANRLFRNNGDETFSDQTTVAGLDILFDPEYGGSYGGMAAGDFNDDGWPDIYVGVMDYPNRLFLNDGAGGFHDATSGDIGDEGEAFSIAVGDIDNDGDLDIFQGAGGSGEEGFRSLMLLNLGEGQFLDVTEAVGLGVGVLGTSTSGTAFTDVDNDGDLDLVVGSSAKGSDYESLLLLNDGTGAFVDQTATSGIEDYGAYTAVGDYDEDGFVDLLYSRWTREVTALYCNNGNDNHWLRVELVGVESSRNGIGSRLLATSGDLEQMREILGGRGREEDERIAHFGLGDRTQVDRLEIRWPSGQVDFLTDIPVDQKIRVIEGRGEYHPVRPTVWERYPPDSLVVGTTFDFQVTVRPTLFEPDAEITRVRADLSELGGPDAVELTDAGDGSYYLEPVSFTIESSRGLKSVSVMIDQVTSLGTYWTRLSRSLTVIPDEDFLIFGDALLTDWQLTPAMKVEIDAESTAQTYQGTRALELRTDGNWRVSFNSPELLDLVGYDAIQFAIHPGDARGGGLVLSLDNSRMSLLSEDPAGIHVDLEDRSWQVIEIPLASMDLEGAMSSIVFTGRLEGTFYLDDIRLVATTPPPSSTAVLEEQTDALPQTFTLAQNYPNPFNSTTVIRYALPTATDVDLAIFNLAGQQVAALVQGVRQAGTYTMRWDGRDDDGRALASGVYLYRLRTGDGKQVETRKLLLLR